MRMLAQADRLTLRGRIVGAAQISDIVVEKGRVLSIQRAGQGRPDVGSDSAIIGPTLFDIQVNGAYGFDLQSDRVEPEDVQSLNECLAGWGVSMWVPTLMTGPVRRMERGCRVIAEALQDRTLARAIPGIHLEGPHISPVDGPRGAHPKQHVRKPDLREFDRMMRAADGKIAYVTVAPETSGALAYIKGVVKRGAAVALGHHAADADTIGRAIDAGARWATHLGNGLAPVINRHHNPLWPQLADDRYAAALIADLHHVPAPMLKTIVRAKGPQQIILVSDCVHITGLKAGRYELAGAQVELLRSGRINLVGTDMLAGSGLMLLQGVFNAARVAGLALEQAFACASSIPAGLLGVKRRFQPPAVGKRADFILFEGDGRGRAVIRGVWIDGQRRA